MEVDVIAVIAVSAAIAAALVVLLVGQLIPARSPAVTRRVAEVATMNSPNADVGRRRRQEQREQIQELLERLGSQLKGRGPDEAATRALLTHAGYRSAGAVAIYAGARLLGAGVMAGAAVVILPMFGWGTGITTLAAVYVALIGYLLPLVVVRSRARRRQKDITLTLPDALDLLVVCVEAGLGLNQAFVRVADEIHPLSEITAAEFHMMNLEIRAGTARDQALRNLFERTGVEDVRMLTNIMIQADRFGTSVANALRVHAETLRDKRRQRAEEAAAKTTIKMVFPLVLCIFPAIFVVLVGPGLIQILAALGGE
jgi:tight adherence protein C